MRSYIIVGLICFAFGVLATVVVPDLDIRGTYSSSKRRRTTKYKGGSVSRPRRRRRRS